MLPFAELRSFPAALAAAPATGDSDYLIIIGVLAVTAIAIVAILLLRRKK